SSCGGQARSCTSTNAATPVVQSATPAAYARAGRSARSGRAGVLGRSRSAALAAAGSGGLRVGETDSVTTIEIRSAGRRTLAPQMPLLALSGGAHLRVQMPARPRFRAAPAAAG